MKMSFVSLLCGRKKLEKSSERRKNTKSSKKSCKHYSGLSFSFCDALNVYNTVQLKDICLDMNLLHNFEFALTMSTGSFGVTLISYLIK